MKTSSTRAATPSARVWDLPFVLPNLVLSPGEGLSSSQFSICSLDDPLIKTGLRRTRPNRVGRRIARQYRTAWGKSYVPSVLLVRAGTLLEEADLPNYRNICAISTIAHGVARTMCGSQWLVTWSDAFCLGRFVPGHGAIVSLAGTSRGYWLEEDLASLRGTTSEVVDGPQHFTAKFDRVLLRNLSAVLVNKRRLTTPDRERIFRSLAVAFHAARYPSDGITNVYDLGTRLALWVSAFEALVNPRDRDVRRSDVLDFLDRAHWCDRRLAHRRHARRNRRKDEPRTTCLAGAIYQRLYTARNRFLHGSPFRVAQLKFRGRLLLTLAPVLFGVALHQFLRQKAPDLCGPNVTEPWDEVFRGQSALEEALWPSGNIRARRRRRFAAAYLAASSRRAAPGSPSPDSYRRSRSADGLKRV
jgi:hypothetical protein